MGPGTIQERSRRTSKSRSFKEKLGVELISFASRSPLHSERFAKTSYSKSEAKQEETVRLNFPTLRRISSSRLRQTGKRIYEKRKTKANNIHCAPFETRGNSGSSCTGELGFEQIRRQVEGLPALPQGTQATTGMAVVLLALPAGPLAAPDQPWLSSLRNLARAKGWELLAAPPPHLSLDLLALTCEAASVAAQRAAAAAHGHHLRAHSHSHAGSGGAGGGYYQGGGGGYFGAGSSPPELVQVSSSPGWPAARDWSTPRLPGGPGAAAEPCSMGSHRTVRSISSDRPDMPSLAPGAGGRLLLVSDDKALVQSLQRLFTKHGYYRMVNTFDAQDGLHLMLTQTFCAVIIDNNTYGLLDGFDLVARYNTQQVGQRKKDQKTLFPRKYARKLPGSDRSSSSWSNSTNDSGVAYQRIVLLDAASGPAARARAKQLGVAELLPKPCRFTALLLALGGAPAQVVALQSSYADDPNVVSAGEEHLLSDLAAAAFLDRAKSFGSLGAGQHNWPFGLDPNHSHSVGSQSGLSAVEENMNTLGAWMAAHELPGGEGGAGGHPPLSGGGGSGGGISVQEGKGRAAPAAAPPDQDRTDRALNSPQGREGGVGGRAASSPAPPGGNFNQGLDKGTALPPVKDPNKMRETLESMSSPNAPSPVAEGMLPQQGKPFKQKSGTRSPMPKSIREDRKQSSRKELLPKQSRGSELLLSSFQNDLSCGSELLANDVKSQLPDKAEGESALNQTANEQTFGSEFRLTQNGETYGSDLLLPRNSESFKGDEFCATMNGETYGGSVLSQTQNGQTLGSELLVQTLHTHGSGGGGGSNASGGPPAPSHATPRPGSAALRLHPLGASSGGHKSSPGKALKTASSSSRKRKKQAPPRSSILKSVLVVDDDKSILKFLTRMLSTRGLAVATATNGAEALEMMQEKGPYDVVLLDNLMPVMTGAECTRRFREWEVTAAVTAGRARQPVVMLSANAALANQEAAMAQGVDAFLAKPCKIEKIISVMEQTVQSLKQDQQQQQQDPIDSSSRHPNGGGNLAAGGGLVEEQSAVPGHGKASAASLSMKKEDAASEESKANNTLS